MSDMNDNKNQFENPKKKKKKKKLKSLLFHYRDQTV